MSTYSSSLFFPPSLIFLWASLLFGQGILVSIWIWNRSPCVPLNYKTGMWSTRNQYLTFKYTYVATPIVQGFFSQCRWQKFTIRIANSICIIMENTKRPIQRNWTHLGSCWAHTGTEVQLCLSWQVLASAPCLISSQRAHWTPSPPAVLCCRPGTTHLDSCWKNRKGRDKVVLIGHSEHC